MSAHSDYNVGTRGHRVHDRRRWDPDDADREPIPDDIPYDSMAHPYGRLAHPQGRSGDGSQAHGHAHHARTREFVSHGRRSASRQGLSRWQIAVLAAVVLALLITVLALVASRGGPGWPSSVATVQAEADRACQNPDVASEPDQVNFACNKASSQILWVFSLMTSGNNPAFTDAKSGREGLEPIAPAQGGTVAWSLNLRCRRALRRPFLISALVRASAVRCRLAFNGSPKSAG